MNSNRLEFEPYIWRGSHLVLRANHFMLGDMLISNGLPLFAGNLESHKLCPSQQYFQFKKVSSTLTKRAELSKANTYISIFLLVWGHLELVWQNKITFQLLKPLVSYFWSRHKSDKLLRSQSTGSSKVSHLPLHRNNQGSIPLCSTYG
eukprot:TRINITY_DN7028_c0_g1_i1.p1 TRINITY_DN7028_c0_g1~~TRINITY_DN7028_c0_g1_i1.p1  ORF type:complete len:148 (-),score=7.40 TRINITY_DN7028_c0_g1_i1:376-819(-)